MRSLDEGGPPVPWLVSLQGRDRFDTNTDGGRPHEHGGRDGAMCPQAKGCQPRPDAGGEAWDGSSLRVPPRRKQCCDTLI